MSESFSVERHFIGQNGNLVSNRLAKSLTYDEALKLAEFLSAQADLTGRFLYSVHRDRRRSKVVDDPVVLIVD